MSKYSFARMSPEQFEAMAQALLEPTYRVEGNLIQFGAGAFFQQEINDLEQAVLYDG